MEGATLGNNIVGIVGNKKAICKSTFSWDGIAYIYIRLFYSITWLFSFVISFILYNKNILVHWVSEKFCEVFYLKKWQSFCFKKIRWDFPGLSFFNAKKPGTYRLARSDRGVAAEPWMHIFGNSWCAIYSSTLSQYIFICPWFAGSTPRASS